MRIFLRKALIIGWLLLAGMLAGCSTPRLIYNNGPTLVWWWLDGYVDFTGAQAPAVKQAIEGWFDWHRATQLPAYATLLVELQRAVPEPTTPAAACRWSEQMRDALQPALERALATAAARLPTLSEAQLRHIEQRYAKSNDEMRDEFLQPDPAQRLKASVKRAVERSEMLYGTLGEAQRKLVAGGVAESPFDPEAWLAERQRRQRDVLQTLRRLQADNADVDARLAALRVMAQRWERSADPAYRAYQQRLVGYNCDLVARLHNAATAEQRRAALDRLKGWEADLRALAAAP